MSAPNPDLDAYFDDAPAWADVLRRLRHLCLETDLCEERKWRQPCYTLDGKNVVIVSAFNDAAVLGFFKGVLLADPHDLLVQPGRHTQSSRHLTFTSLEQVDARADIVRAYIEEAIANERAGRTVQFKTTEEYDMPVELAERLSDDPELRAAWDALTPGRQRGYLVVIGGAKRSATRHARIEKHRPRILLGKGIHDR